MTREQRAEWSEWCRQRANDLQLMQTVDWLNPMMFAELSGQDLQAYLAAALVMEESIGPLREAQDNYENLAKRLEANAD